MSSQAGSLQAKRPDLYVDIPPTYVNVFDQSKVRGKIIFYSRPHGKNVDLTKLKAFADENLKMDQIVNLSLTLSQMTNFALF